MKNVLLQMKIIYTLIDIRMALGSKNNLKKISNWFFESEIMRFLYFAQLKFIPILYE